MKTIIYTKEEYFGHLKKLRQTWRRKKTKFTLFIGAGFSINFGMPNWNDYAIKKMNEVFRDNEKEIHFATTEELKKLDKKHLLTLVNNFYPENTPAKAYEEKIFEIREEDKEKYTNQYFDFINSFKNINASIVTTNYDNVLEEYFGFHKRQIPDSNEYLLNCGDVVHIHGDIKAINEYDKIITTWKDYYQLYFANHDKINDDFHCHAKKINEFLGNLFRENEILFIGYSITEIEILKFIFERHGSLDNRSNITIVLPKMISVQADILYKLYEELGINVIFLDLDKDGYFVLIRFLQELSVEFSRDLSGEELFDEEDIW